MGLCNTAISPIDQWPPEACMASTQSDFMDFLGLFTQPPARGPLGSASEDAGNRGGKLGNYYPSIRSLSKI